MISKPFIEVYGEIIQNPRFKSVGEMHEHLISVRNFYSQPFSIDILVNSLEKPKEIPDDAGLDPKILHDVNYIRWYEAEDKVLFEGIKGRKVKQDNGVDLVVTKDDKDVIEWHDNYEMWILDGASVVGRGAMCLKPNTLDHFLYKIQESNLELHWKQSIIDKYFKS